MNDETELEKRLLAIWDRWSSASVIVLDGGEARDIRDAAAELQSLRAERDRLREVNRRLVDACQKAKRFDWHSSQSQWEPVYAELCYALALEEKAVQQ